MSVDNGNFATTPSTHLRGLSLNQSNNSKNDLSAKILEVLRRDQDNRIGLTPDDVARVIRNEGGKFTMDEIANAFQTLSYNGNIYTTVDDSHYCTTE